MKKVIILFIMLVALGNLVFADLAFGAWGRSIFNLAEGNDAVDDITQSWGPGWGVHRLGVDFNFTSKFVDYHMNMRTNYATLMGFPTMYGTLKLVPDMFSLHMGQFSGDGFDTFRKTSPHPINDKNNGDVGRMNGWGLIGILAPKDSGFEAGVMWATADPMWDDDADPATSVVPFHANIEDNAEMVDVAAAYTVPGTVKITAGSMYDGVRNIFGRVELLMVKDLTLWADAKYVGLESSTAAALSAMLAGGYKMDALTIAFAAGLGMGLDAETLDWSVYPEVYYNLGAVTAGIYLGVSGGDTLGDGLAIEAQPYVVVNDFNLRISVDITYNTDTEATTWAIPVLVTFGF
ncbi:MAG: hypothetical protein EHM28_04710 [Spirochaetaceae bacterium]|nr:MAG: hypothetical protein EHM28_04710 [Spirochaetaceae bacterium]